MDKVSSLDWSLVQSFLAIAEEGSLSGAARRLGQSQPTLGRHLAEAERALGHQLFRRQPRGMALTEIGQSLLPAAQAMRDAAGRLQLVADGQSQDLTGTVRITASIFMSHYVLPDVLAQLRADHPQISLELVPSDTTENLLFREADIAVRMYRPQQLDIVTRHLGDIPLGVFAAKTYLDRRGRLARINDFFDHDVVGYDTSELILREMRRMGYSVDREWFTVRCDHQSTYWELVRAGCGIGFSQVPTGRADPLVEEIDIGIDIPPLPVWLSMPEKLRHNPRVRQVWDALAKGISAQMAAG